MAQRILALEIDGDEVRAAVAERTWNTMALVGVFSDERASEEGDLTAALARLIAKTGRPDLVISALPGELVALRLLEFPFHDRRRLDQAVPFALEEHLPFSVDDAVVAHTTVARKGDTAEVVAAMVRKNDLRLYLDQLARAGLDPKTVTLSSLALPALFSYAPNGKPTPHLLLDVDRVRTSMILLDEDGSPRALRTLKGPLEVEEGEHSGPVLNAVRHILLAHSSDPDRPDVIVTGPHGCSEETRRHLARELAVEVRGAAELHCVPVFDGVTPENLRFAGCISMLLGEAPVTPVPMLNFRHAEFSFRGFTGDLGPLRTSGYLAIAIAVIALLHLIMSISLGFHRVNLLDGQIRAAAAPILGPNPPANVQPLLNATIVKISKQLHLMGRDAGAGAPLDVLLAVSQAIPSTIPVDIDEMSIDDSGLKISARTDSFATVDQVKKALASSGRFQDIQVTDAKAASDASRVEFRLTASSRESSAGGS